MNNWSIEFAPLLPVPFLIFAGMAMLALLALLAWRHSRGLLMRSLAMLALLAALANPTLRQEERETLANIAIVVVDRSTSQALADRPGQTDAVRRELETRLGKVNNLEVKWVVADNKTGKRNAGTRLFESLNTALENTPPDRIAGVVMITDGQVHDVPKSAAALGFESPVHVLLTGRPDEFDRRLEVIKAPRYGIVGTDA